MATAAGKMPQYRCRLGCILSIWVASFSRQQRYRCCQELSREDTPWFAQGEPWHRPTVPEGGAEWGREMVEAWATALADELDVRCGRASAEEVRQRREAAEAVSPVAGSAKL